MEMMEKVERLREKANVTYEEAKAALEQTGGDLLDAMVLLERQSRRNPRPVSERPSATFSNRFSALSGIRLLSSQKVRRRSLQCPHGCSRFFFSSSGRCSHR